MKCKHEYTTVVRGIFPHGTPVAIHQCDYCGMTLPRRDTPRCDVWLIPALDEKALAVAMRKIERSILCN